MKIRVKRNPGGRRSAKPKSTYLPHFGDLNSPVYMILDPVVMNGRATKPLSERQMQWLADHLKAHGFKREDVCIISCAPSVTSETWQSGKATNEHLKEHRDELIRVIHEADAQLLMTFGAKATQQIVGRAVQITKVRGQPIEDHHLGKEIPVVPLYSPFYAQRQPENEATFVSDVATASRIYKSGFDITASAIDYKHDYQWCYDLGFMLKRRKKPKRLSVDVETVGVIPFDPATRLLTVQLCAEDGVSYCVPINYDRGDLRHHGFIPWGDINRKKLLRDLKRLLTDPEIEIVGQNFKFDWMMLYYQLGIEVANYAHDTMLMAHLLDENQKRINLDDLVRRYVPEMAGFNDRLNDDPEHVQKSRMDLLTPDKMLRYACGDPDAALRLTNALQAELNKDEGLTACYTHVTMPGQRAFCHVELNGFAVSVEQLRSFEKKLRRIQKLERAYLIRQIPKSIKDKWRDSGVGVKVSRASILVDWLYEHKDGLQLEPKVRTKTGQPSVSTKLAMPHYVADYPVISRLIDYLKNEKLLNTYVKGFYKYIYDNLIRPSYSLVGTVTGRSSCVRADTLVDTERGQIQISDIKAGDKVYTHKGRLKPVKRVYEKPIQDMYAVHLSNGSVIHCTEEHRILLANNRWDSLRNVCVKTALGRQETAEEYYRPLYEILKDCGAGSGGIRRDYCDSDANAARRFGSRDIYPVQESEILGIKDGRQKPGERKEARELATYGASNGWSWIPDNSGGRQKIFCSSGRIRGGTEPASIGITGYDRDTSHRRGYDKQRPVEPCGGNTTRASQSTQSLPGQVQGPSITKVEHCGSYPVYDLEVAGDHSYTAGGICHHNSRDPNGQNFPKRGKLAKEYRKVFKAPPGYVYISLDLSQAELRIAAMMSGDPTMLGVYAGGGDIHAQTAAGTMGLSLEEFMKLPDDVRGLKRFQAKAVNFGFLYGMWWVKFREYAKTDYGIDFTEDEAKEIRENFFKTYPMLEVWHREVQEIVMEQGLIRTFDGRVRHLPNVFSDDEGIAKQAQRQAINSPVQSIASDLGIMTLGRLMPYLREKGYDEWLKPCGFIHDAIVCLVREDKVAHGCSIVKNFMENNPLEEWFGWEPEIPILADAEIGRTLAETHEIDADVFVGRKNRNKTYADILMGEAAKLEAKAKKTDDSKFKKIYSDAAAKVIADAQLSAITNSTTKKRRVKLTKSATTQKKRKLKVTRNGKATRPERA